MVTPKLKKAVQNLLASCDLPATVGSTSVQGSNGRKKKSRRRGKSSGGGDGRLSIALPAAKSEQVRVSNPMMQSLASNDGRIRVTHREYICDVLGSPEFQFSQYAVNPGLEECFPWLSSMARNYESYLFRKLTFEYRTSKGSSNPGSVHIAMDFDAADSPPETKLAMMQTHGAVRSSVWADVVLTASAPDLQKFGVQRFTRRYAVPAGTDIKTYDIAKLFIAVSGCNDYSTVGELYVSYVVDLITPQPNMESPADLSAKVTGAGVVSRDNPFGTAPLVVTGAAHAISVPDGDTIAFSQVGDYIGNFRTTGSGLVAQPVPGKVTNGGVGVEEVLDAAMMAGQIYGNTSTIFRVTSLPAWVTFDYSAVATTLTQMVARFAPYSHALA